MDGWRRERIPRPARRRAQVPGSEALRVRRERLGLTQTEVATRIGSSQSRVATMEAGDPSVSTDLLLRSLFRLGARPADVARLLNPKQRGRAA